MSYVFAQAFDSKYENIFLILQKTFFCRSPSINFKKWSILLVFLTNLIEVGGTFRYLQISAAWVFFNANVHLTKDKNYFWTARFFHQLPPKKVKNHIFSIFLLIYLTGSWFWCPDITNTLVFYYLKNPSPHVYFWPYFPQKTRKVAN